MDIAVLNTIRRLIILSELLKAQSSPLFAETARSFVESCAPDTSEIFAYREAIELVKTGKLAEAIEALEVRMNYFKTQLFDKPCNQKWNDLIPTNEDEVRFCTECKRNVFKVVNKQDYIKRKELNQCVAISFPQNEKFIDSTGCEISFTGEVEFLGDPATIDDEQ